MCRRPSLDWPNLSNQKGFKTGLQGKESNGLILPEAASKMVKRRSARAVQHTSFLVLYMQHLATTRHFNHVQV